jgi:hypothetical protein
MNPRTFDMLTIHPHTTQYSVLSTQYFPEGSY